MLVSSLCVCWLGIACYVFYLAITEELSIRPERWNGVARKVLLVRGCVLTSLLWPIVVVAALGSCFVLEELRHLAEGPCLSEKPENQEARNGRQSSGNGCRGANNNCHDQAKNNEN